MTSRIPLWTKGFAGVSHRKRTSFWYYLASIDKDINCALSSCFRMSSRRASAMSRTFCLRIRRQLLNFSAFFLQRILDCLWKAIRSMKSDHALSQSWHCETWPFQTRLSSTTSNVAYAKGCLANAWARFVDRCRPSCFSRSAFANIHAHISQLRCQWPPMNIGRGLKHRCSRRSSALSLIKSQCQHVCEDGCALCRS